MTISVHFSKFAYKMDFHYKSMKLRQKMDICLQLLGYSLKRLLHLMIRIILIIYLLIRRNLQCLCNMECWQVLIAGLLINMRLHPLFNQLGKAMMSGLEIVGVVSIVGNISTWILMERMGSFGNLVFKRWENMIYQLILIIFAKILPRRRSLILDIPRELP